MDEFTVDANFESASAGTNQLRIDARLFTNESRQTGSFGFVISDRAIFDRDFWFHGASFASSTLFTHPHRVEWKTPLVSRIQESRFSRYEAP